MSKTLKERSADLKGKYKSFDLKDKSLRVVGVVRESDRPFSFILVAFSAPLSDDELRDFHEFVKTWKPS